MAITLTAVTGARNVIGNQRSRTFDCVFSSTYATGGESITAAAVGLRKIYNVIGSGVAISTDLATANPVGIRVATAGTSVLVTTYEGSADGTALAEKTNSEAHATGSTIRLTFLGY